MTTRKVSELSAEEQACVAKIRVGDVYDTGWTFRRWSELPAAWQNKYRKDHNLEDERASAEEEAAAVFRKILKRYGEGAALAPSPTEREEPFRKIRGRLPKPDSLMGISVRRGEEPKIVHADESEGRLNASFLRALAFGAVVEDANGTSVSLPAGLRIKGVVVDNLVDLAPLEGVGPQEALVLEFNDCWLREGLNLQRARLSQLAMMYCTVSTFDASYARFEGAVLITASSIGGDANFFSGDVAGALLVQDTKIAGDLSLNDTEISHGVTVEGGRIDGNVLLNEASIHGSVNLGGSQAEQASASGAWFGEPLVIGKLIRLDGAELVGQLRFSNVHVLGAPVAVYANGARLRGGVSASDTVGPPGLVTTNGAVAFLSSEIGVRCNFSGAKLQAFGSDETDDDVSAQWRGIAFWMRDCTVDGPLRLTARPDSDTAARDRDKADIAGLVGIRNTVVDGNLELWGTKFDASPCDAATVVHTACEVAIELIGVSIKHDLHIDEPPPPGPKFAIGASHVEGAMLVRRCHIEGDIIVGEASWNVKHAFVPQPAADVSKRERALKRAADERKRAPGKQREPRYLPIALSFANTKVGGNFCINEPTATHAGRWDAVAQRYSLGGEREDRAKPKRSTAHRCGVIDFTGATLRAFMDEGGKAWGSKGAVNRLRTKKDAPERRALWDIKGGVALRLVGCGYQRLDGAVDGMLLPLPGVLAGRSKWLDLQWPRGHDDAWAQFNPEPYHVAAKVLQSAGEYTHAHYVMSKGFGKQAGFWAGLRQLFWGWLFDYGYGAVRTTAVLFGLLLLGVFLTRAGVIASPCADLTPITYAIDAMLIGIDLGPEERCPSSGLVELWKIIYGVACTLCLVLATLIYSRVVRREL